MGSAGIPEHGDRAVRGILAVLILLFGVRLLLIGRLGLAPDEAYYWLWSQHLDTSYYDHPPMVAWIMALFTAIGGSSEWFVRIGGFLCALVMTVLLFASVRRLFPQAPRAAWETIFLANGTLLFSAGCLIQTPDTPLLLFWVLAFYAGIRILRDGDARWWYLWGLSLGGGLLSKYTMALFAPCQFAFLILSRRHRFWLCRREPYLALLLSLIVFSPVLLWNMDRDWISFSFQLSHGLGGARGVFPAKLGEYLGGQALVVTPLLFLAFAAYSFRAIRSLGEDDGADRLYLLLLSWPMILLFAFTSLRGNLAEPNWPAPAYIAGLVLLWDGYRRSRGRSAPHRRWMAAALVLAFAVSGILHAHLLHPFLPIPPQVDNTHQFHGWRDLGDAVNRVMDEHPHPNGYFLVSDRGTLVAEAVFYSRRRLPGVDFLRPERYTFLKNPQSLQGKHAVLLLRQVNEANLRFYGRLFTDIAVIGRQEVRFRGVAVPEYSTWILWGKEYRGGWPPGASLPNSP